MEEPLASFGEVDREGGHAAALASMAFHIAYNRRGDMIIVQEVYMGMF